MQIRVGYELIYDCPQPTPMILTLHIHSTRVSDIVIPDHLVTSPSVPITAYRDGFGNWCSRIVAPAGETRLAADAVLNDAGAPDGPRIGRVLIARGRDAADVAITNTVGPNTLKSFKVWTDEVIGSPP